MNGKKPPINRKICKDRSFLFLILLLVFVPSISTQRTMEFPEDAGNAKPVCSANAALSSIADALESAVPFATSWVAFEDSFNPAPPCYHYANWGPGAMTVPRKELYGVELWTRASTNVLADADPRPITKAQYDTVFSPGLPSSHIFFPAGPNPS